MTFLEKNGNPIFFFSFETKQTATTEKPEIENANYAPEPNG